MSGLFLKSYIAVLVMLKAFVIPSDAGTAKRALTGVEVRAVIQAVEDEIYSDGDYTEFNGIGDNVGAPHHWKCRLPIYIKPEYGGEFEGSEGIGAVIYKFAPYGEIVRLFTISNGRVLLVGDPANEFPITQPSHRILSENGDQVRKMTGMWLKRFFVVDISPPAEVIDNASRRHAARKD